MDTQIADNGGSGLDAPFPGRNARQGIRNLLVKLYGDRLGPAVFEEVSGLICALSAGSPVQQDGPILSSQDVLLISYPDQVRQPGCMPLRTLADFAKQWLTDIVSAIHILPFYPWTSDDGFSAKSWFEVAPEYGSWSDLDAFRPDFGLMFDGVFNHMSAQSDWFQRFLRGEAAFRDFFVTVDGNPDLKAVVRPRTSPLLTEFEGSSGPVKVWTTFSSDQVDLNFRNPRVLVKALEAILLYVRHGARFVRLDAIGFLWKEIGTSCIHLPQTHWIVQLFRAVLDAVAPGTMLITETNVPHEQNISYFGDGTNEAHLVYNFSLPPLVLHALATGNAQRLTDWARTLSVPGSRTAFLNFLASHDGIGINPARGILNEEEITFLVERAIGHGGFVSYRTGPDGSRVPYELNINYLDALSAPKDAEPHQIVARKFLTAESIMVSLQGVPAIYFHSLFGSRGDRAGAEASGIPRRINRQKLDRAQLESELRTTSSLRAHIYSAHSSLLRIRRSEPAFAPHAPQAVPDIHPRLFAVLRGNRGSGKRVLCLHNVSSTGLTFRLPADIRDDFSSVRVLWSNGPVPRTALGEQCALAPWQSVLLSPD
ncbi:MAG: sugar phosphorylase [Verrucomicrobiota bacterium]|nr:sugar phosphorylase [Verrucomicrobiota bacterium]